MSIVPLFSRTCVNLPCIEPPASGELARDATPLQARKRQLEAASAGGALPTKRVRLTRRNLTLFNNIGRRKGTKASAAAPAEYTDESSTTKTTSTTTSGFATKACENGILNPSSSKPPANLDDRRKQFARSRETASPPESVYKIYVDKVGGAVNEATMVYEVGKRLLKDYDDTDYRTARNQPFTGFPRDVGLNNGLSAPQPDLIEGTQMQDYDPFPIHKLVVGAVLYKNNPHSVTLSHLAGEWKGAGKDMEEARLQSAYDGAALVYTRNQALSYLGNPDPPGHAEVMTFTTDGTTLNQYAHYADPSEGGTLRYHQYPIKSTNLIDSHQAFKEGRRSLRNSQDYAREQSYALRDQLKGHWKQHRDGLHAIAEGSTSLLVVDGASGETNADGDEGEAGYEVVEACQPTPTASSRPYTTSSSVSASKSPPPANDHVADSGGQKRKASSPSASSRGSSRHTGRKKSYWDLDDRSGRCFHRHSDGRVTWKDDTY